MLTVTKFGGSSLADEAQFEKVKNIVLADDKRRAVVVSAPGRRDDADYKITDLLYLTYSHIKYKVDYSGIFDQIKKRFFDIKNALNLSVDLEGEFTRLEEKMKARKISEEELVCKGEYFSALLLADYIGYRFVDAKDIIHFNYNGKVDIDKTCQTINEVVGTGERVVIPGFYGSYPDGSICLFSRGGSDVTASYVAKALKADLYENWTDVSGFYMVDPRVVKNPKKIKEVTYDELRELSYLGASVLHEETILPIQEDNIPINILNTNCPNDEGTIIAREAKDKQTLVTGITGKKGFVAITIVKTQQSDKLKVMLKVLKVFDKYAVTVEHIPTSIDTFSIVCENDKIEHFYFDIISELKQIEEIKSISEDSDIAIIGIVGRNMATKPGISGKLLSVFGQEKINIKLIDQGTEELNIIVGISNEDFNKSINFLYEKFA